MKPVSRPWRDGAGAVMLDWCGQATANARAALSKPDKIDEPPRDRIASATSES
jgi:hypothetical protein